MSTGKRSSFMTFFRPKPSAHVPPSVANSRLEFNYRHFINSKLWYNPFFKQNACYDAGTIKLIKIKQKAKKASHHRVLIHCHDLELNEKRVFYV